MTPPVRRCSRLLLLGGALLGTIATVAYVRTAPPRQPLACRTVGPGVLLSLERSGPVQVVDVRQGGRRVAGAAKIGVEELRPPRLAALCASLEARPAPVVVLGEQAIVQPLLSALEQRGRLSDLYFLPNELLEMPTFADLPQVKPAQFAARPLTLIDLAEPHEFAHAHVAGSRRVQFEAILAGDRSSLPPRDQPVALICPLGRRSQLAGRILKREGYKVTNIEGGFIAWQAAGLPLVGGVG